MKYTNSKLNVVIPMAGDGSRFAAMGYTFPKPLIDIRGKPMIQLVVENLNIDAHYIFIARKDHVQKYDLRNILNRIAPGCDVIELDHKTSGAACTVWEASNFIDNSNPLIIANCDQLVGWNPSLIIPYFEDNNADGGIITFKSSHPKWSYVKLGETTALVEKVAEKQVISDLATVGIYYWRRGYTFLDSSQEMIRMGLKVNGEYYIAPTFNHLIAHGGRVLSHSVMYMQGLGTPEDLQEYLRNG